MSAKGSYRLTVRKGPTPGKVYELAKDTATLGRDIASDLVVNDPEVSRNHIRLTAQADGWLVEDLASTNGTFINDQRIAKATLLRPGDTLGLGETVVMEFSFVPEPGATVAMPDTVPIPNAPAEQPAEAAPKKSNTLLWAGIGCGCLTLLACAALIAIGWYLWNVPVDFWRSIGF